MQRRFLEAHLGYRDPAAAGFDAAANPVSPVYGGRMVDPAAIHVWTWDARPYPAFPGRTDIWSDGGNWRRGHWLTGRLGQAPVDALIRALLSDHGFDAVDVSGVEAMVGGFVVPGPGSARSELEDLMRLCGVAAHGSNGRLVFRSIGSAGRPHRIETLADEDDERPPVEFRRSDESETVEEIVVSYLDAARAYQPGTAEAVRSDSAFPRQDTIALPVVLEEDAARAYARAALGLSTAGREAVRLALPPSAIEVDPGDVVEIAGIAGRWLVTRIESGPTRQLEARMIPAARPSARDEAPAPSPPPGRPNDVSEPFVLFLDLPLGNEAAPEDAARIASFVHPPVPLVVEASVGGSGFETRLVDAVPSTMGEILQPMEAGPEGLIHAAGTVDVKLYRGALFSISREGLVAGGNLAAVRSRGGQWELLQFEGAEELAPGIFRLRCLVRGQGGTEDAMMDGADAGAPFVLLDRGVERLGLKAGEIGTELQWRIAGIRRAWDDPSVATARATLGLRALRPFSPVHIRGAFDADGGLALSWLRRTRISGDGWEGLDVPLGEEIERYRIVVSDGTAAELTVESDLPRVEVSAARQMQAFAALPARLVARVSQFSLRHGAGTERQAVFDRPSAA